jgi:hypothetical protein
MRKEKILKNTYTVLAQCPRGAADAVEAEHGRALIEMLRATTQRCTIHETPGD